MKIRLKTSTQLKAEGWKVTANWWFLGERVGLTDVKISRYDAMNLLGKTVKIVKHEFNSGGLRDSSEPRFQIEDGERRVWIPWSVIETKISHKNFQEKTHPKIRVADTAMTYDCDEGGFEFGCRSFSGAEAKTALRWVAGCLGYKVLKLHARKKK